MKKPSIPDAVIAVTIAALVVIGLVACTVVEPPPAVARPAKVAQSHTDRDKTAETMLMCDRLGYLRQGEGWRNCMMRGMDRYVDHQSAPVSERYQLKDQCGQPPCAPQTYAPAYPAPAIPPQGYQTPDGGWVYPSYVAPQPLYGR